ncbi:hypothetical protein BJ742DRAFT_738499 [Cladochytrium replicatum]|nr:hypothetical protein BJ742DRAFT_738499 [Cladochytrium replicatum]
MRFTAARRIAGVRLIPATPLSTGTRVVAGGHNDHHNDHHDDHHHPAGPSIHPEEYLKIAREWPHEQYWSGYFQDNAVKVEVEHEHPPTAQELAASSSRTNTRLYGILGVAGILAYAIAALPNNKNGDHPITAWMQLRMHTPEETLESMANSYENRLRASDDALIMLEGAKFGIHKPGLYRISFPETFEKASDFLIEPGTRVDFSDFKIKHNWEQDDHLFGPPYPKEE